MVVFLPHSVFCLNYPLSAVFTLSLLGPVFFLFFPVVLLVRASQRINVSQRGDTSQSVFVINVTLVDNISSRLLWVFPPSYCPVLYSEEELCNFNYEPEDHQSCIFYLPTTQHHPVSMDSITTLAPWECSLFPSLCLLSFPCIYIFTPISHNIYIYIFFFSVLQMSLL